MGLWLNAKKRIFVANTVTLGRDFHLGVMSWVSASVGLTIGDHVYVGKFCTIQCNGSIGDGVLIGNNVGIVGRRDHDCRQIGTMMSRARRVGADAALNDDPCNRVTIGADVWIGFGAIIVSGITIGRGAIIGAGSVVRSDVAPYDVVAGNPATAIARRFTAAQIAEHEAKLASAPPSGQAR